MNRRTILVFVATYLPGFKGGGPIRSVSNLIEEIGDEFNFKIITLDRDWGDTAPYPEVNAGVWSKVGKAEVLYLSPSMLRLSNLRKVMGGIGYDLIYLNSFFHPVFSIFPLVFNRFGLVPCRPVVLAPRGEFSSGALSIKSAKKRAFLALGRFFRLYDNVVWQASSDHEVSDIRTVVGGSDADIRLAPAIPKMVKGSFCKNEVRLQGLPLKVVFLARISPMKNLLYALDVLSMVRSEVEFSIFGPKEDLSYWGLCETAIGRLPSNIKAKYCGALPEKQVEEVLSEQDLFFLPTQGENFGHSIAESLSVGLRVLISDRTMWRDLEREGVGYDFPLESSGRFVHAIESEALRLDRTGEAERCREYLVGKLGLDSLRAANRKLFE